MQNMAGEVFSSRDSKAIVLRMALLEAGKPEEKSTSCFSLEAVHDHWQALKAPGHLGELTRGDSLSSSPHLTL